MKIKNVGDIKKILGKDKVKELRSVFGNTKYLPWIASQQNKCESNDLIKKALSVFVKIKRVNNSEDIFLYSVFDLLAINSKESISELKKRFSYYIYKDKNFKLIRLTGWDAAKFYIKKTIWCISNYSDWTSYSNKFYIYLLIIDNEKYCVSVAKDGNCCLIHNSINEEVVKFYFNRGGYKEIINQKLYECLDLIKKDINLKEECL